MTAPVPATPESPAALLRHAAAHVRAVATDTSCETPWQVEYSFGGERAQAVWRMHPDHPDDPDLSEAIGGFDRPGDNVWAAAMAPAVAEPLAAWLDIAAAESQSAFYGPNRPHPAEAVARALLGEPS